MNSDLVTSLKAISVLRSLILFGSAARNDQDADSDTDYCAIISDIDFAEILEVRRRVAEVLSQPLDAVAIYSEREFLYACQHGSLFLEHVRREGIFIFDRENFAASALQGLSPFENYEHELSIYRRLLADLRAALDLASGLTFFDLHILHGIARDGCIMLTYRNGSPAFGRETAFRVASSIYPGLPLSTEVHSFIADGHLTYLRRGTTETDYARSPSSERIMGEVEDLMDFCAETICD